MASPGTLAAAPCRRARTILRLPWEINRGASPCFSAVHEWRLKPWPDAGEEDAGEECVLWPWEIYLVRRE